MKKVSRKLFTLLMLALFSTTALQSFAQEESPISVGVDLASRYVWRGADFGSGPSIQPGIEYGIGNFTIGAWGAYNITGFQGQEMDLYIGYSFLDEMISLSITDYFFPVDGMSNNYFDYGAPSTGHIFEGTIAFNGLDNLPISALVGVNFFGDDKNVDGINRYSSYFEIAYSPTVKDTELSIFAGINLNNASEEDLNAGIGGFYGDKMGFCNVGLSAEKEIKVTNSFSIPLNVSVITNPLSKNIYLVAGLSL